MSNLSTKLQRYSLPFMGILLFLSNNPTKAGDIQTTGAAQSDAALTDPSQYVPCPNGRFPGPLDKPTLTFQTDGRPILLNAAAIVTSNQGTNGVQAGLGIGIDGSPWPDATTSTQNPTVGSSQAIVFSRMYQLPAGSHTFHLLMQCPEGTVNQVGARWISLLELGNVPVTSTGGTAGISGGAGKSPFGRK